jgi:DNA repair ATPase RecN
VTSQEVEQIKRHVDEAVQGLRGEMAAEFAQVRGEISDFRRDAAEVADHLMQEIVETRKNAGAEAEELRSQIRAVAEGVALANERLNDVDLRVDTLTGEVRRGFAGVRAELHSLHETDDELRRRIEAQEQRGA